MPSVTVKWRGTNYTVEIDENIKIFRNELSKLTNVLPERMKLVMKGKTIASDGKFTVDDFKYLNSSKSQIVMFGEASVNTIDNDDEKECENMNESTDSYESIHDEQFIFPCGLVNLGNNCYMNSVLQSLYAMVSSLNIQSPLKYENNCDTSLVLSLMAFFQKMSSSKVPLDDRQFFYAVHQRFPFFAERSLNGDFLQHDANEFFIQLMNCLKSVVKYENKNFVEQFFMGKYSKNMKCSKTGEENQTQEEFMYVPILLLERSDLQTAIGDSLKSSFTKRSAISGEEVEFSVNSKFQRLPAFLTINYLRFAYKDQAQKNCKIFRQLSFPFELDIFDYCTNELKQKFDKFRKQKRSLDEVAYGITGNNSIATEKIHPPIGMDNDFGCNNTGIYSLRAVITHKGRTTSNGHYVSWIRRSNVWFKCDDSNVSVVSERDVSALSGGADSHLSYILFYGPTNLSDQAIFQLSD